MNPDKAKHHFGRKGESDISAKLAKRLYACFSETQLLIPNELIGSVRNTIEDIDRKEEMRRKRKEKISKFGLTSYNSGFHKTGFFSPEKTMMPPILSNLPSMESRDFQKSDVTLPALAKTTTQFYPQLKEKPSKKKKLGNTTLSGAAKVRAEATKELEKTAPKKSVNLKKNVKQYEQKKESSKSLPRNKEKPPRTDMEIIKYFEEGKNVKPKEYAYCKKGEKLYEFKEERFDKINTNVDDYITISSSGVTCFIKKEAEFMTLPEWKDEVEKFKKIHQIKFFENFKISKSFSLWKKQVKRTKMVERGAYLSKELFHADNFINKSLINIRRLLNSLQSSDILNISQDQSLNLERMSDSIREKQEKLKHQLESKEKEIKRQIKEACDAKIKEFNQDTRIFGKEETKKTESKEDLPYHIFADDTYHPMPFTVRASTNTLNKRLARFIRLVEYMLMQLKLNIIKNSYNNIWKILNQKEIGIVKVNPIFKVTAKFKDGNLSFSPSVDEVKKMISQRLSDGIRMICNRPILSEEEDLKKFIITLEEGNEHDEGKINPLQTVEENEELMTKRKEIEISIDKAFVQLQEYEKELLPFIKIYNIHSALDFNKLEGQADPVYRVWVENFEKDTNTISSKLEKERNLGIIVLDAAEMKNIIMEKPVQSRNKIEKIIPQHIAAIVNSLTEKLKSIEDALRKNSTSDWKINEYVKFRQFLDYHRENIDEYEEQLTKAKSLHQIISDFQMKSAMSRKNEVDPLSNKWKIVRDKLRNAVDQVEAQENKQKSELAKSIPEIREELNKLLAVLDDEKYYKKSKSPETIVESLSKLEVEIEKEKEKCTEIKNNEHYLQMPKDKFPEKTLLVKRHTQLQKFWNIYLYWQEIQYTWKNEQIKKVDIEKIKSWITQQIELISNIESFDISKELKAKELYPMLSALNVINNVLNDKIGERHWGIIAKKLNCPWTRDDPNLTLGELMEIIEKAQIASNEDKKNREKIEEWIEVITKQAKHEYEVSTELDKIKIKWETLLLRVTMNGNKLSLEEPERLFTSMDECINMLQVILSNEYAAPLRDKADQLYRNIATVEEIITEIVIIEKKIKNIEEIVVKEEYKQKITSSKLDDIQKDWKKYIKRNTSSDSSRDSLKARFLPVEGKEQINFLEFYRKLNKKIDEIQNEIFMEIDEKQMEAPRLCFIPTQEYFALISDPDKERLWNKLIPRCFPNISEILIKVENEEEYPIGVVSREGEIFKAKYKSKNRVTDPIDKVFNGIEEMLKKELTSLIKGYFTELINEKKCRTDLLESSLYQVAMVGENLIFTINSETVIEEEEEYESNIEDFYQEQCMACADAGKMLTNSEPLSKSETNNSDLRKLMLSNIIIQYVHYRDIVDFLIQHQVKSINSFYWQQQLRYYQNEVIVIKQLDSVLGYGYEYLGIPKILPITPSIERCWVSYTSALRNKLCSSIVGPEDMGKINTIKDLAIACGKYSYVYSCSSDTCTRVLKKLLLAGTATFSWIILDKADNLSYAVLSSFSCILQSLRQALIEEKPDWSAYSSKQISLLQKPISNIINCPFSAIFMVLDKYNTEKSTFPAAIKSLFRPITLLDIDIVCVAETMLFSLGFREGTMMGKKMVIFFNSVNEILKMEGCSQIIGLRMISMIIDLAGKLRNDHPEITSEINILLKAIFSVFESRFSESIMTQIEKIIRLSFQKDDYAVFPAETSEIPLPIIQKATADLHLQYGEDIEGKLNVLHQSLSKRKGCILSGATGCGKSTLIRLLVECYKIKGETEKSNIIERLYTKSYSQTELYGQFTGKEWADGILITKVKELNKSESPTFGYNFLVCDGPLDSVWVETFQSGLESKHSINLANGDLVKLNDKTKILFEIESLSNVSPAIISRTSAVYLSKDFILPIHIIYNWMCKVEGTLKAYEKIKDILFDLINKYFCNGIAERGKIPKSREEPIYLNDNTITSSFCRIVEITYNLLEPQLDHTKEKIDENRIKLLGKVLVFATAWSLGGSLSQSKTQQIDKYIVEEISLTDTPKGISTFDSIIRIKEGGEISEFVPWIDEEKPIIFPEGSYFTQILVPTQQIIRYKWFLQNFSLNGKSTIMFGESGCGKSLLTNFAFQPEPEEEEGSLKLGISSRGETSRMDDSSKRAPILDKIKQINLCFTYNTTSDKIHASLEKRLEKRRRGMYSGPCFKKAVIFIDDVNLPREDNFGVMPTMECLREIAENGGYYDRTRYFWKKLKETSFVINASPANGARKELNERFVRHFNLFKLSTTSYSERRNLYNTTISSHLSDFPKEYSIFKSGFLESVLEIHDQLKNLLGATPKKPHYLLSYKDCGRVLSGLMLGHKDHIQSVEQFCKLIAHEYMRTYMDRYMTEEDIALFIRELDSNVSKYMNMNLKLTISHDLYFSNISEIEKYQEVKGWISARDYLISFEKEFNSNPKNTDLQKINLVFFKEAVEYILKIGRILFVPRNNLVNIGPSGMGRSSLIRLATIIFGYYFHSIDYSMKDFENAYRAQYSTLNINLEQVNQGEGVGVVLYAKVWESVEAEKMKTLVKIQQEHVKNTTLILDDIYQILGSGDLSHIGEIEKCEDVRDYMHIILTIPNKMDDVREKMRMYPGLFSECYLLYQNYWPFESSVNIIKSEFKESLEFDVDVASIINEMHYSVSKELDRSWIEEGRKIFISIKQSKEIVQIFHKLYEERKEEVYQMKSLLDKAISTVNQSTVLASQIQAENFSKRPELEEKVQKTQELSRKCHDLEIEIENLKQKVIDLTQSEGKSLSPRKKVPSDKITETLAKAKADLTALKPAIKKLDWNILKSVIDPSQILQYLVEIVWILTMEKKASWDNMQKLMMKKKSDQMIAVDIINVHDFSVFDAKILFEKVLVLAEKTTLKDIESILMKWAGLQIEIYNQSKLVFNSDTELEQKKDEIFSLMQAHSAMKESFEEQKIEKEALAKYKSSLDDKHYNLNDLHKQMTEKTAEWQGIEEWEGKLQNIDDSIKFLLSDTLFAAGVLTYFGPFSTSFRESLRKTWATLFQSRGLNTRTRLEMGLAMGNPNIMEEWHLKNLLRNDTCIENAFILHYSDRCPIMVDPEGVGMMFLSQKKKIRLSHPQAYSELSKEMSRGSACIIDNVPETIDPDLINLFELEKNRSEKLLIMFGGSQTEVHPNFSFILRTDHYNPIFRDDILASVNVINFGLNLKGLQDLFIIEYCLITDSQDFINYFLNKRAENKKNEKLREDNMLKMISQLELTRIDEEEQKNLKNNFCDSIKDLTAIREELKKEMESKRQDLAEKISSIKIIASRWAVIYRCASKLTNLNPVYMYCYSMIKDLFSRILRGDEDIMQLQDMQFQSETQFKEGISKLTEKSTKEILTHLRQGIFERDFKLFVFSLKAQIAIEAQEFSEQEWLGFLYGMASFQAEEVINKVKNPNPKIISEESWKMLAYFESVLPDIYEGISKELMLHFPEWTVWINEKEFETKPMPGKLPKFSHPIRKLIIIRVICPERIPEYVNWVISEFVGEGRPEYNLKSIFLRDSKINKPLMILKEEGEDPQSLIQKFGGEDLKLGIFTMNADNEPEIKLRIDTCKRQIEKIDFLWIYIRDVHIIPEFAYFLAERIKECSVPANDINEKFRIIFSLNTCRLPRTVLKSCIRFAISKPHSMKEKIEANMNFMMKKETATLAGSESKEKYTPPFRRLVLSMCMLHTILQKRNIFGSQAWTRPYKVYRGDLEAACKLIFFGLELEGTEKGSGKVNSVHWDSMRSLLENITLGGRIVEEYDRGVLGGLIEMYINEDAARGNFAFIEDNPYRIPAYDTFPELISFVQTLPSSENHDICGLSDDSTLRGKRKDTNLLLQSIIKIDAEKKHYDQLISTPGNIQTIFSRILTELPENGITTEEINPIVLEKRKGLSYGHHLYLLQEMARLNSLILLLRTQVESIQYFLHTGNIMSTEIEKLYYEFSYNRVPESILGYSWNHPLGEWLTTLVKQIGFIREWLKAGEQQVFWLRGLIYPKGLFNSYILYFAQKYEQDVERISFVQQVTECQSVAELKEPESQTIYIRDLFLVNAKFNTRTGVMDELSAEEQKKFSGEWKYSRMPLIAFTPTIEPKEEQVDFPCPVYFLSSKQNQVGSLSNLITKVDIPSDLKSQYWILKQVRLTCVDPQLNN